MNRFLGAFSASLFFAGSVLAADCPDAKSSANGFTLELPGVKSEYSRISESVSQVENSYEDALPQTHFFYRGLIEIFRTSKEGPLVTLPSSDLNAIFPLKTKKKYKIKIQQLRAGHKSEGGLTLSLEVTGKETLILGDCEYAVTKVKESMLAGDGSMIDTLTLLYSPDLEAVLAKRYDEGSSQEQTIRYETITPPK